MLACCPEREARGRDLSKRAQLQRVPAPQEREREREREKERKRQKKEIVAFFFSFLSPTISFASQNCSTISSADAFPPAAFPFFSAHKGKMVRLIASSCSADAGSSLRHSGREIGERDEEARRRRASELLSPLSLSLPLSCSRCGGWEQKKREPPPRLLRGPLEPSATLLSASLTGRWHQPLRRGLRGRSTASERERGTMRTDEEERWRTAGGGKGAPPPPPPLLSSEAGFLAALLSVRLRVLADLDRVCALCRERGHQLSRGSLGTRISLSIFARCFFRSGPPSIDFFLFRSSCHFSLPRPKQNAGPLLRHRPPQPAGGPRGPQAQAQEARPVAQQLLHGCQVPGLLPDHRRVQQLADGCRLPGVLGGAVHAHGREGEAYRGLLVQEEGRLERELECVDGGGQGGEEREREKRGTEMIRSRNFPAAPSTSLSLSPSLDLLAPPT